MSHNDTQAYIRRETRLSVLINMVFSLVFFLLVFGIGHPVPVWGMGHLAFDTLPQSAAIAAMSTLVPGFIARSKTRRGLLPRLAGSSRLPRNIWLRALVVAALSALLGGALAGGALLALGASTLPWWPVLAAKLAYGAGLAGLVTPITLAAALR
ncbi:MAG: hypothetical protein KGJ57_00380 [Sphingomonadales bacterium]|nr:hypothetical protein [Sphingomonadales bacterium]MDE2167864.1 hypothetical protein [Sphingomonadales bacterium]